MTSPSLIDWLRTQLDTDERLAEAAIDGTLRDLERDGAALPTRAELLAFHGGLRRRLAEVESKRAILDEHEHYVSAKDVPGVGEMWTCRACGSFGQCRTIRALAKPYADREGFREEWAA